MTDFMIGVAIGAALVTDLYLICKITHNACVLVLMEADYQRSKENARVN